jgi:hypothetical protein
VAEFATLAEVKAHANIPGSANDDELVTMLDAAEDVVRSLVGSFAAVTVTERVVVTAGTVILSRAPSGAVTLTDRSGGSVTGFTVSAAAGLLYDVPVAGGTALTASYPAGGGVVPASVSLATAIIAAHLWETQRGTAPSPLALQGDDAGPTFGAGFALPNRARELLAPYTRSAQVA